MAKTIKMERGESVAVLESLTDGVLRVRRDRDGLVYRPTGELPDGYAARDYVSGGSYLGADVDGVEPRWERESEADALEGRADGTVADHAGSGVWVPSDEAAAEIEASDDPARAAWEMCRREPTRGKWHC